MGFELLVEDAHYARFKATAGDATFSLHAAVGAWDGPGAVVSFECDALDEQVARLQAKGVAFTQAPRDEPWLWREARLVDPSGNVLCLYHAGVNRLDPPWRIAAPLRPTGMRRPTLRRRRSARSRSSPPMRRREQASNYPEPFASQMAGRLSVRWAICLAHQFGVNLTRLAPAGGFRIAPCAFEAGRVRLHPQGQPTLHTDEGHPGLRRECAPASASGTGQRAPAAERDRRRRWSTSRWATAAPATKAAIRTTTCRPCVSTARGRSCTRTARRY